MSTQPTEVKKKRKMRSPSYPAIDLETAIDRARIVYQREARHFVYIETIVTHWGYGKKSSGGLLTLSALNKFGLIEDQGTGKQRQIRLSELALKIVLDDRPGSQEKLEAIREAALKPSIHAELWNEYDGTLPSEANLSFKLRSQRGFTDSAASDFIREFKRTIEFAKLSKSDALSGDDKDKSIQESDNNIETSNRLSEIKGVSSKISPTTPGLSIYLIPVSLSKRVSLQGPFPLNEDEWNQMLEALKVFKPGLVSPSEEEKIREESSQ